jgi:hypothetical protein
MKSHVESSHNHKRSVAILTNVDENKNPFDSSLGSLAVEKEQVDSALGGLSFPAKQSSMLPNPSRGILSSIQPPADVIYMHTPLPKPTASSIPGRRHLREQKTCWPIIGHRPHTFCNCE